MKTLFIPIITFAFCFFSPGLSAQEKSGKPAEKKKASPIKKKEIFIKNQKEKNGFESVPVEIGVLVEYISLEHKEANVLLGKFAGKANDVEELRDTLEKMIDQGSASLIETMWVIARTGQRAKTQSVSEHIYATGYDPAEIPNNMGSIGSVKAEKGKGASPAKYYTSATPTAFETRDVGSTLEVDPILTSNHKLININLAPEIITRLEDNYFTRKGFEKTAYGVEHVFMPTFYAMKDTTQIEVIPGKYSLLGFHTPPKEPGKRILVLLRADLISVE